MEIAVVGLTTFMCVAAGLIGYRLVTPLSGCLWRPVVVITAVVLGSIPLGDVLFDSQTPESWRDVGAEAAFIGYLLALSAGAIGLGAGVVLLVKRAVGAGRAKEVTVILAVLWFLLLTFVLHFRISEWRGICPWPQREMIDGVCEFWG